MELFTQEEIQAAASMCWLNSDTHDVTPEFEARWIEDILLATPGTNLHEMLRLQCELNRMKYALRLAKTEIVKSGNWHARDYNWPTVQKAINDALKENS